MEKEEKNKETEVVEEQGKTEENETPGDKEVNKQGNPESDLPKSQEELDKLIERRIRKERKVWENAKKSESEPEKSGDDIQDHTAEIAQLRSELLEAKAQSAAVKLGFRPEVTDDAVYLAMRIANNESNGEPDADDIKDALSEVLKKHPEWKNNSDNKNSGFKVGAPPPQRSEPTVKPTAAKRWNRFN